MAVSRQENMTQAWLQCSDVKKGMFSNERVIWVETLEGKSTPYLVNGECVSGQRVRVYTEEHEGRTFAHLPTFEYLPPVAVRTTDLDYS